MTLISTEEIVTEEPAAEAVAPAPVMKERSTDFLMKKEKDFTATDL